MPDPDLPALVTRAQAGDRSAFERLVHLNARIVYAQIVATVRDRAFAEDLTQETFLAAWKNLHKVTSPAGFTSWLLTIAKNATLDALKAGNRKKRTSAAAGEDTTIGRGAAAGYPDPSINAELSESQSRALELLAELPDEYRLPLTLRYLAGADYHAIRAQLQLTDGALRGLLSRGMTLLRERMTKSEKHDL